MSIRSLCRGSLFLLLMAPLALAQFTQLTATDDGTQLYFRSQQLLKGKDATTPQYRLYRFGTDGVTLFAERGDLAPEDYFAQTDGVWNPTVSGDGTVVAFTFFDVCLTGPNCTQSVNEAVLRGRLTLDLGPGMVQLSRNGNWALVTSTVDETTTDTLVDLVNGKRSIVSSATGGFTLPHDGNVVASDGTVLVTKKIPVPGKPNEFTFEYALWKQGKLMPLTIPGNLEPVALTDDASALAGYLYSSDIRQIVVMNLASGKLSTVFKASDPTQAPILMAVSNNGRRVLYLVRYGNKFDGPAYVWDGATGVTIPVPLDEGEFASDGTLTGPGQFAFVATTRARIVKFPVQTGGAATSLFPAQPHCDDPGALAGGSIARLHCGFSGSVSELRDHLLYNGDPAIILYSNPREIGIQIPWRWGGYMSNPTLSNDLPSASPFQADQPLSVWEGAPAILPADNPQDSLFGVKIIKGDWSGYVTRQPLPGDIVHIYMTGLGPVDGSTESGVPASATKLNPILWELACRFQHDGPLVKPLFAGLAPGMIGVYQTTFPILPANSLLTATELDCELTAPNSLGTQFNPGSTAFGMCSGCGVFVVPLKKPKMTALR